MEQCKSCVFYDKHYDMTQQIGDDIIEIGKEGEHNHYCRQFENKIDNEIIKNKKKCENYLKKQGN